MDEDARIAIAVLEANAKNTDANLIRLEGTVDAGFTELKAEMKEGFQRLDGRIDKVEVEMKMGFQRLDGRIDAVKDSLAGAKIWALILYIALAAGLLGSMAQGFLWLADKIDAISARLTVAPSAEIKSDIRPPNPAKERKVSAGS